MAKLQNLNGNEVEIFDTTLRDGSQRILRRSGKLRN